MVGQKETLQTLVLEASNDLKETVAGIPQEQFEQRPAPHANSAGFIYFHVLRHWDWDINIRCQGQEPDGDAWHRSGMNVEFDFQPTGMGIGGLGTGIGFSDAEVDAAPKDRVLLEQYHDQLLADTKTYFEQVTEEELNTERTSQYSYENPFRPERWLRHMIAHTFMHIGDIQYVKGLIGLPDDTYPGSGS